MKARFEWRKSTTWDDDVLRPNCEFLDRPADFRGSLAWLLTDDGGNGSFPYFEWAKEGLQKLESVKLGAVPEEDWSTNSWCGDIEPLQVIAYFFYDETQCDIMPIDGVEQVLKAWIAFLRKGPDPDRVEEIDVHLT